MRIAPQVVLRIDRRTKLEILCARPQDASPAGVAGQDRVAGR
jgi:hypothetical protein